MKILLIAALVGGLSVAAHAKDEHKHEHGAAKAGATETLTGEIVDLNCYLTHGGAGEKHGKCAKQCVKNGAPMGLQTEKGLYLLIGDHSAEKAYDAAKELAGGKAKVTGKVASKGGVQALVVAKAEGAK